MEVAGHERLTERRLPPLPAEAWGEAEYAAFGALLGIPGDKVPRAGSGDARDPLQFDIIGLLVRHPKMARAFLTFNGFLLQRGELPARLRELTILRVAHTLRSAYEWGQHVKMAAAQWHFRGRHHAPTHGNDGFEGADRLVLDATDELLANGHARWETWQALAETLGERARNGVRLRRRCLRAVGDGVRNMAPATGAGQRAATGLTLPGGSPPERVTVG